MEIAAIIERNGNGYYQISSDDEVRGCCFGGYGYSVDEAKADFYKSIEEMKCIISERGGVLSHEEEHITVEFKYDIPSFFNCFQWINISRFAELAGINPSQMRKYKNGISSASESTMRKIIKAINDIGSELQSVKM